MKMGSNYIGKIPYHWSKVYAVSLVMIFACLVVAGCGGGGGGSYSGASGSASSECVTADSVGTGECYGCHADGMIAEFSGEQIFSKWLAGPHANLEGSGNIGSPANSDSAYATNIATCSVCHDKLSEGSLLDCYYASSAISDLGIVERPMVGCESCHGSGANHYGIGALPNPAPRSSVCGQCHSDDLDQNQSDYNHMTASPETDDIYSDYASSLHASSISASHYATGSTTDVKATCSKCHTDEGARLYKDVQTGHDGDGTPSNPGISTLIPGSDPAVADATVIQCSTCHDAHSASSLLRAASGSNSSEYQTCTNCHQVFRDGSGTDDSYHGKTSAYSWSGHVVNVGTFDATRTILDTHDDDDTTTDIEGYVINYASNTACRDCHNPHSADKTINENWANSAHGGFILTTLDATTGDALVTDSEGPAWVHYDFKSHPSRDACQRCHTSTGFKNLVTDPAGYDPANNTFVATSNEKEMLYCWACHTSSVGDLRDPGAFSNVAPYSVPAARISAVPDINGSNLCMSCHSGRISGQQIHDADLVTEIQGTNFGSWNSHYLAAGGILYRTIGYEFSTLDYSNVVGFAHEQIGTTSDPNMGSNGPCVACHFKTDNSHTLEVVTGSLGSVTAIDAYTKVCSNCHASESTLVTTLNTDETGFSEALDEMDTLLQAQGIYYCASYPYFKTAASCGGGFYTSWPDKDTIGSAFNLNLLKNIPGAYVHNKVYVQRLIYDSIDFLDNGAFDDTVAATLTAASATDALTFLGGGSRP